MKKAITLLVLICILTSTTLGALADNIKVPIDISSMDTADLLALDEFIHQELTIRGEAVANNEPTEESTVSEVTAVDSKGLDTMAEGEKEMSDETFLADMSAGLSARWAISDQDTTTMSNKQMIDYYSKLVNCELVYLDKYSEYTFTDERLGSYAHAYINALNNQFIGITEYYGKDDALYNQYWATDGYNIRARFLYLINKEYGLHIPSQYNSTFSDFVKKGSLYNYVIPMETAVANEISKIELKFDTSSSNYLYVKPFNLINTSPYDISGLTVKINFIDKDDVIVESGYLLSYADIKSGKAVSTQKASTDEQFTHVSYSYSFTVSNSTYYHECEATIIPAVQYSWDGRVVKKNGELATGQAALEIKNLTSGWEMNTSWSKTLYVPVLKFDILNNGTGAAENIVVKVVFTNPATKEVWSEETSYVVSSSDSPLKVGYSKKAFVYSSVGYTTKVTPQELTADIYINNQLIQTVTVR